MHDQTNITMIRVERHEANLLFQNEIARRARNYLNFTYTIIITSQETRLPKDKLATLVDDSSLQYAYICGPTRFMPDMTEHLVALSVPPGNIVAESIEL